MPSYEVDARIILTIQMDDETPIGKKQIQEAFLKTEVAVNAASWCKIDNGIACVRAHFHNIKEKEKVDG